MPADGARRSGFDFPPIDVERGFDAVDELRRIAHERGSSPATVALAWLLAQPGVTSVIVGANQLSQLEANLRACDLALSAEEVAALSKTTAPRKIYPEWMVELQNQGRLEPKAPAAATPATRRHAGRRG